MALQQVRFDFDAVRRAYAPETAPEVAFVFFGDEYHLLADPLLGDTFDLKDAPEHRIGENDLDTIRVIARFVRAMLVPGDRLRWDDAVRRLPVSQATALVELLTWVTEQVTTFPTSPPADSSAGRQATGPSSKRRTAGRKA